MNNGTVQTFHDFNWSAKSKISGKEYYYPCHCRWEWESNKISKTSCYVDPTGIFAEVALYQEKINNKNSLRQRVFHLHAFSIS